MKMKLGVLWCIVLTLPHVRSYFLPSGKQCTYKNMLGSPGAPTMFTAVVVRMPNDDDEVLAKFQKFDTSQQQQYISLMENQTLSPYTGAPRTSPRPLQAPFNRTTRFGIAISYFKTVANEYDWLKWSQLEETHGRKLHIVLVDESLRWYHHVHPSLADTADNDTVFYVDIVSPAVGAFTMALDFVVESNALDMCVDEAATHVHGQSNDPNVLLAAVSVPVMQLNIVPSASEAATPAVQAASPQPIAKVGAIISQSQVVPSDTHDELNAMVDVSKSCTRGGGGDEVRAECVAVELRVWERTPYKAVPSADWNWMTEAFLARLELYEWKEVLPPSTTALSAGRLMKPGGCYYVEASVYDHGDSAEGRGSSGAAVDDLRPYLKAAAHLMLTRVDTTMSGGSPINPIHVHGMATAGGPPVTLTPLASPMQRDAVKRCEIMGSGDGMIMADDDMAGPASMDGMMGMVMPPSAFGPTVGAMLSVGDAGLYGLFWSFGRGDALITSSFNFNVGSNSSPSNNDDVGEGFGDGGGNTVKDKGSSGSQKGAGGDAGDQEEKQRAGWGSIFGGILGGLVLLVLVVGYIFMRRPGRPDERLYETMGNGGSSAKDQGYSSYTTANGSSLSTV